MAKREQVEYVLKPFKPARKAKAVNPDHTDLSCCDEPPPEVVFEGRSFCLTGVFDFADGDRNKCEDAIRARGGVCWQHPTRDLNYLVIGTFVEGAWAHKGYGRKIEMAVELKRNRANCKIISEAHLAAAIQIINELPVERRVVVGGQSRSHQLAQLQQEVDELKKTQAILAQILKSELEPSVFGKLSEKLLKAGVVI